MNMPDLMLQPAVFGVTGLSEHFLMCGYLTPTLPQTKLPKSRPATENMKMKREENMSKELLR